MRDPRRSTIRVAAVSLLAALALALPATSRAAEAPRFLLVAAPHGVAVHAQPHGRVIANLSGTTPLGSTTWLWVTTTTPHGRWGRVVLPIRPNGLTGWIDLRGLSVTRTRTWVRASLAERTIWLMRGRTPVATFAVAIGAPDTSTPTGRFSVTDRVLTGDPTGSFGWYAFGLSGHQPHLPPSWAGGDQLAIHGTNDPASIGRPASHGCLRVSASALARLRSALALGTPVVIMRTRAAAMSSAVAASLPRLHRLVRHPVDHPRPQPAAPPSLAEVQPRPPSRSLTRVLAGSVAPMLGVAPPAVLPRSPTGPVRLPAGRDRPPPSPRTPRAEVGRAIPRRPTFGPGRSPPRTPPRYPGSGRSA